MYFFVAKLSKIFNLKKKLLKIYIALFATLIITWISPVFSNYCDANICRFNERIGRYIGVAYKRHIACGNSAAYQNVFGPSCYRQQIIPMTTEFISLILRKHNTLRADTANGRIPGYLPANQMSELVIEFLIILFLEMNDDNYLIGVVYQVLTTK